LVQVGRSILDGVCANEGHYAVKAVGRIWKMLKEQQQRADQQLQQQQDQQEQQWQQQQGLPREESGPQLDPLVKGDRKKNHKACCVITTNRG